MSYQSRSGQRGRRGNPALRNNPFQASARAYTGVDRMTVDGTLAKSLLLVFFALITAGIEVTLVHTSPQIAVPVMIGAFIGGFITSMVTIFKPQVATFTAPLYAVLEGFLLGGISYFFERSYPGIVLPAIGLTLFAALSMLVLYRSQVIRVTPMFTRIVIFSTMSVFFFYIFAIIGQFFGIHFEFLTHPTVLGIAFSLFVVGLACMNLILDFDFIAQGTAEGAPKYMEWYGAFSIMVTLVWLYLEILRLLAKLRR